MIQRELFDDGTEVETHEVTVTETRKTYPEHWPSYNRAQTSEKATFQWLLHDLCESIPEPIAVRMGRPRLPARDGIFCATYKVYSMLSSRRFTSDLCDAQTKGYISRVPHFNSVLNIFDSEGTTTILKSLIAESAAPLASIERNFTVDSSGFSGCRYDQWFATKWKNAEPQTQRAWVKAHAMIGCDTGVITAAEVLDKNIADCTQLPALMTTTARRFQITDVCADKAYSSARNLQAIADVGANAFIPFRGNSTPSMPGVWNTAFHYFNLHRETFLAHYHQRSNIESTFSAIKRKFGDCVKSKNELAMRNEVLAKFLCHNLYCLIQSMEKFGIDPTFGCTNSPIPAQKLRAVGD